MYLSKGNQTDFKNPSITITCQKVICIFLIFDKNVKLILKKRCLFKFRYCNIGWLLTIGDLNRDGFNDLIISSPYASSSDTQSGVVSVLFSNKKG